jgi:hypothetical protein
MVASPSDLEALDVEHEKRLVEEAVKNLQAAGLVELFWLEGQTWSDLQQAMRSEPWHIFHFIGHGGFDPTTEEGSIALSDQAGRKRLLGARDLARLMKDQYTLRLVFLNSCEGAKGSDRDAFSSTAETLVRRGMPAVVAMQYKVTDKATIEFSRVFYQAVADGLAVDRAVAAGRTAISMESAFARGTPVLYTHSPDRRIFDFLKNQPGEYSPLAREASPYAPLLGDTPEGGTVYVCPQGDFEWPQQNVGEKIPNCPNHDVSLVLRNREMTDLEEADREMTDLEEADLSRQYRQVVTWAWLDGQLDAREVEELRDRAKELGLKPSTAADIERKVMSGTIEAILERQENAREIRRPWWRRLFG